MNLILSGLPNCGKTTIGKLLAKELTWEFIDTDELLQQAHNLTCRQLYLKHGESAFRNLEENIISSLKDKKNCVISLGGGTLNHPTNQHLLKKLGRIIYLKASPHLLFERFTTIPAYLNPTDPFPSFLTLAEKRIPLYESLSSHTINTDQLSADVIMKNILSLSF